MGHVVENARLQAACLAAMRGAPDGSSPLDVRWPVSVKALQLPPYSSAKGAGAGFAHHRLAPCLMQEHGQHMHSPACTLPRRWTHLTHSCMGPQVRWGVSLQSNSKTDRLSTPVSSSAPTARAQGLAGLRSPLRHSLARHNLQRSPRQF